MTPGRNVPERGVLLDPRRGRPMKKQGSGRIVATSSMCGRQGTENLGAYVAAKWGVIGLVKTAAIELGPHNVHINAVCPRSSIPTCSTSTRTTACSVPSWSIRRARIRRQSSAPSTSCPSARSRPGDIQRRALSRLGADPGSSRELPSTSPPGRAPNGARDRPHGHLSGSRSRLAGLASGIAVPADSIAARVFTRAVRGRTRPAPLDQVDGLLADDHHRGFGLPRTSARA